jgi:uncharacterized repeat protein (TIGR03803 family)
VFKLTRHESGYSFTPLCSFKGGSDGYGLLAVLVIGPDGSLFGTTSYGGTMDYGTIFNLRPPAGVCPAVSCAWTHTVLYSFTGQDDGMYPMGGLAFDQQGNPYGSTYGYSASRDNHQYPTLGDELSGNPSVRSVIAQGPVNPYGGQMLQCFRISGTLFESGPSVRGLRFPLLPRRHWPGCDHWYFRRSLLS